MDSQIRRCYEHCGMTCLVRDLKAQEERDRGYVEALCRKFNLRLTEIHHTFENGNPELSYVFDDGLGGYTLDAVIGGLMLRS